jgi:hypothetical protein
VKPDKTLPPTRCTPPAPRHRPASCSARWRRAAVGCRTRGVDGSDGVGLPGGVRPGDVGEEDRGGLWRPSGWPSTLRVPPGAWTSDLISPVEVPGSPAAAAFSPSPSSIGARPLSCSSRAAAGICPTAAHFFFFVPLPMVWVRPGRAPAPSPVLPFCPKHKHFLQSHDTVVTDQQA